MTIIAADNLYSELWSYYDQNYPYGDFTAVVDAAGTYASVEHSNASWYNGVVCHGHFHYSLYVFITLDVAQGTPIGTSYLTLPIYPGNSGHAHYDILCTVKGRAVDDCPYPTINSYPTGNDGTAWRNEGVAKTTASATLTIPAGSYNDAGDIISGNISEILQEIVDRPGWTSGNTIGLYIYYTGTETENASATGGVYFSLPSIDYSMEYPVLSGVAGPGPKQNTLTVVDWSDADSYNLYWPRSSGVTKSDTKIAGTGSSPAFLHSGLLEDTTYCYAASVVLSGVETELSNEVSLKTFGATESSAVVLTGQARLSLYINEEIDAFDVFAQLNAAVGSYLFNDHLGKYRYVVYNPPTGASVMQFTEADIFSFEEIVDATEVISRVKVKYQHRVTQDYWQVRFAERVASQYLQGAATPILKEVEVPFVQLADGLKVANRTVVQEGIPQRTYKCKVSSKGWTLLPSDFIQITYSRHGVNSIFEVIETKRDLKTGQVTLTIGGLRGLFTGGTSGGFGYPGHWCAEDSTSTTSIDGAWTESGSDGARADTVLDGAETETGIVTGGPSFPASLGGGAAYPWSPTWTTEQKAYAKQNFGYFTDDSGFADPTDPESYLASTWA